MTKRQATKNVVRDILKDISVMLIGLTVACVIMTDTVLALGRLIWWCGLLKK